VRRRLLAGEILCILASLPYFQRTNALSVSMPNALNFSFHYYTFLLCVLASYVPGSPFMFNHMRAQRRKVLGGGSGSGDKGKSD
jgi:very-long-chain (3R)-3-hydroxyacyl-CoA dehydratase